MVKRVESMVEPSTDQTKEELLTFVRDMRQPRPPRPLKQRRVKPFRRHQVRRPAVKYSPEIKKLIINLYCQNGYRFSQITSVSGIWFFITVRSSSIVWSFHSRSGYIGVVVGARRGFTFGNSLRVFTLGYSPYHQVCFSKGNSQWSRVLQVLGHVL